MCRILVSTGPTKREQALRLIEDTARAFAPTQPHGFGFAVLDHQGELRARGRYFKKYTGWGSGSQTSTVIEEGHFPSVVSTIIIHGRTSTNVLGVDYCHPFVEQDTVIAHNGVLTWRGDPEEKPEHPNDTGAFLQWFVEREHPSPSSWANNWAGYGALIIARPGQNLQMTKCGAARLTMTPRHGTGWILSTSPTDVPSRLTPAGARPRWVSAGTMIFNRSTGELLKAHRFEGFAARKWDAVATRSLGYRGSDRTTLYTPRG